MLFFLLWLQRDELWWYSLIWKLVLRYPDLGVLLVLANETKECGDIMVVAIPSNLELLLALAWSFFSFRTC